MNRIAWLAIVLGTLPVVALATACAAPTGPEATEVAADAPSPKVVGELSFSARSADVAQGSYTLEKTSIGFHIRREGATRRLTLTTASGQILVESEYRDGLDTMRVLGGRAVKRGGVNEDGSVEGDPKALDELFAMPEAKLVTPMKEALAAARVDPFLLGRDEAGRDAPVAPGTVGPQSYYDGYWWYLGYGEQVSFATWSFWGWTTLSATIVGASSGNISCLQVQAGWASPESLCGSQSIQRQWGGARLYVTFATSLCPWSPRPSCSAGTYRVRTY